MKKKAFACIHRFDSNCLGKRKRRGTVEQLSLDTYNYQDRRDSTLLRAKINSDVDHIVARALFPLVDPSSRGISKAPDRHLQRLSNMVTTRSHKRRLVTGSVPFGSSYGRAATAPAIRVFPPRKRVALAPIQLPPKSPCTPLPPSSPSSVSSPTRSTQTPSLEQAEPPIDRKDAFVQAAKEAEAAGDQAQAFLKRLHVACDELQLSSLPKTMIGREEERQQVFDTLRNAIQQHGAGNPIYISGLPGMGKTSTVKEILRSLEQERDMKQIPGFHSVEVNGLSLPKPEMAYCILYKAICRQLGLPIARSLSAARACQELEQELSRNNPARSVLVVLLDEMDFMLTNKHVVLYNILEWQALSTAKLVLVGIANVMDLPERLNPKVRSRFGAHRIAFSAYSSVQLQQILEQRLRSVQVFDEKAIEIYSKTLAHQSGDARKALMVCRSAAELCLRRIEQQIRKRKGTNLDEEALAQLTDEEDKENLQSLPRVVDGLHPMQQNALMEHEIQWKVVSEDLQRAHADLSNCAQLKRLESLSKFEAFFVLALHLTSKSSKSPLVPFEEVTHRMTLLCKVQGGMVVAVQDQADFRALAYQLERSDILRIIPSKNSSSQQLQLVISPEELQEVAVFQDYGISIVD